MARSWLLPPKSGTLETDGYLIRPAAVLPRRGRRDRATRARSWSPTSCGTGRATASAPAATCSTPTSQGCDHQVGGRQRRRARHRAVRPPVARRSTAGRTTRAWSTRCGTWSAIPTRCCSPRSSTSSGPGTAAPTRCTRTTRTGVDVAADPRGWPRRSSTSTTRRWGTAAPGRARQPPRWHVADPHRRGRFGQNEIDPAAYPGVEPVPVEVEAGSTVSFGPMLVHKSRPNTSELDRRALLFSYQPAGPAATCSSTCAG